VPVDHPISFTPEAADEALAAQDWYESQSPGLGARFRVALDAVVQRISANPVQFPIVYRDARRALLPRFPYFLVYRSEADLIVIIACFHTSRDPQGWQRRARRS
jgi:plasmid stabilization system protein ParE